MFDVVRTVEEKADYAVAVLDALLTGNQDAAAKFPGLFAHIEARFALIEASFKTEIEKLKAEFASLVK